MIRAMKTILLPLILLVLLALVACSSNDESLSLGAGAPGAPGLPGNPGAPGSVTQSSEDSAEGVRTEKQVIVEREVQMDDPLIISASEASTDSTISSMLRWRPVPTISLDLNSLPAITRGSSI